MRISVKNEGLTCLDCEHSDKKTIGKISVDCKKKKISVFPSNAQYMRCQCEKARKKAGYGVIVSSILFLLAAPVFSYPVYYDYNSGEPYIPYNSRPIVAPMTEPSTFSKPVQLDFTSPLTPNSHVGVTSPSFTGIKDGYTDRWGNVEIK